MRVSRVRAVRGEVYRHLFSVMTSKEREIDNVHVFGSLPYRHYAKSCKR